MRLQFFRSVFENSVNFYFLLSVQAHFLRYLLHCYNFDWLTRICLINYFISSNILNRFSLSDNYFFIFLGSSFSEVLLSLLFVDHYKKNCTFYMHFGHINFSQYSLNFLFKIICRGNVHRSCNNDFICKRHSLLL